LLKALVIMALGVGFIQPVRSGTRTLWATANELTPRESQVAVPVGVNRLLIAGGEGPSASLFGEPTSSAEIYSVRANRWRIVGSMSAPRNGLVAARLADGRVLAAGGEDDNGIPLRSAETFNPRTNVWTSVAPMPNPAAEQSAVTLKTGSVLVTGGIVDGRVSAQALLFNPSTDTWAAAPSMRRRRAGHESVLLPDGDALVAGGTSPYAEIYDPVLNRWTPAGRPGARVFPALVRLGRSNVLMAAGETPRGRCLSSAVVYTPAGRWVGAPAMQVARCAPLSTSLPNGDAIVGGGFDAATWASLQEFSHRSMRWLPFSAMPGPRAAGTLTYLGGRIVAAGGTVEGSQISTSAALRVGRQQMPRGESL
jgi:hypothetical protein